MTPEPGILDVLVRLAPLASAVEAMPVVGIMAFGVYEMRRSNDRRAEADKRRAKAEENRHTGSMTALSELIRRTSPPQAGPADQPRDRPSKATEGIPPAPEFGPGRPGSP